MTPIPPPPADMIDELRDNAGHISEWEADFLDNIEQHLRGGFPITQRQYEVLEGIWTRVCR